MLLCEFCKTVKNTFFWKTSGVCFCYVFICFNICLFVSNKFCREYWRAWKWSGTLAQNELTYFWPIFPFFTHWQHKNNFGLLVFAGGITHQKGGKLNPLLILSVPDLFYRFFYHFQLMISNRSIVCKCFFK